MRVMWYVRLIRPLYLVGIALVFLAVRYGIIEPELARYGVSDPLGFTLFSLVVLAALLVGAGGFIINDYFDCRDDAVLRPGGVIVGDRLSRHAVIMTHIALTSCAFLLALLPSLRVGRLSLVILFPLAAGVLWFYSSLYKHRFLVGNVLLTMLAFALPFLLLVFEVQQVNRLLWPRVAVGALSLSQMFRYVLLYSVFLGAGVFLYTLVKNLRSFVAGTSLGDNSIAVRIGLRRAKVAVGVLTVLMMFACIGLGGYLFAAHFDASLPFFSLVYAAVAVVVPLMVALIVLLVAETFSDFRTAVWCYRLALAMVVVYPLVRAMFGA